MSRFTGKVAIITGASAQPGIGRACAERLGREGAALVINARSAGPLQETEAALRAQRIPVVAVPGPADADDLPARLVSTALDTFGRLDLLVPTVGGAPHQVPITELARDHLLDTVALNVWSPLALIEEGMRRGLADGGGAVVTISSGSPKKTTLTMGAYAAAKAALNAITRTLAAAVAAEGVRVNAVSPGLTRTAGTRPVWAPDDGAAAAAKLPLRRLPTADDVAAAVAFLLSDDAQSITGVLLDVDAGNHLDSGWSPFAAPSRQ
jgi:NAD(P)-dependent dehydrogenase (short-subunit alcohol dehydrogenase family)